MLPWNRLFHIIPPINRWHVKKNKVATKAAKMAASYQTLSKKQKCHMSLKTENASYT